MSGDDPPGAIGERHVRRGLSDAHGNEGRRWNRYRHQQPRGDQLRGNVLGRLRARHGRHVDGYTRRQLSAHRLVGQAVGHRHGGVVTMDQARSVTATFASTIADLSVTQSASPDPIRAGYDVAYTVQVSNLGPASAAGVVLTDVLSGGGSSSSGRRQRVKGRARSREARSRATSGPSPTARRSQSRSSLRRRPWGRPAARHRSRRALPIPFEQQPGFEVGAGPGRVVHDRRNAGEQHAQRDEWPRRDLWPGGNDTVNGANGADTLFGGVDAWPVRRLWRRQPLRPDRNRHDQRCRRCRLRPLRRRVGEGCR